jgi:hypothetical protein
MRLTTIGLIFLFLSPMTGVVRAQQTIPDTAGVGVKTVVVPEEHSGKKALLLSIVPGGGQIYNRQAWKIPIIYGALAGMGYFIHYNYTRMDMFKVEYLYRVNHNNTPNLNDYASYPTSSIYNLYNSYNRNFQLMIIITVGIYALNLIDAYVFGHLFDFNMDNDISLSIGPTLQPTLAGWQPVMGLKMNF